MQWHLSRAGQVWGPYPWEALASMAAAGQLLPDDLICADGATWLPVTRFVALPAPAPFPHAAPYEAPHSTPAPTMSSTARYAIRPRTSKGGGYACLVGAALVLVTAGIRLAVQIDSASAGAGDSAEKIRQQMLDDGAPPDLAAHAAAGFPLDARDRSRLSPRAQLTAAFAPLRLRQIAAHKHLPLTCAEALLSLCAAAILAMMGMSRLRRAKKEHERAAE